jgi:TetR/AcrR family transcriptional repressor of nem operon
MKPSSTTSDDILACARSLIVSGGYNGFSYADIADVVGIRKASIHHHFPSKAELVRTLVSRYRLAAEEGIANLEQGVPGALEQLRAYIGYWKACIGDASAPFCVCALLAGELPMLPEEVALEVRAYFRYLAGWLTAVFERGVRQKTIVLANAPHVEAEIFMATVHGAMLSARAYGDTNVFGSIMDPQLERMAAKK